VAEDRFFKRHFPHQRRGRQHHGRQPDPHVQVLHQFPGRTPDYRHFIEAFTRASRAATSSSLAFRRKPAEGGHRPLAFHHPKVLILDEPTRGIDAAARGDVYAIIEKLKVQGLAILLISSDMEESWS
jgi:hypothetical protein